MIETLGLVEGKVELVGESDKLGLAVGRDDMEGQLDREGLKDGSVVGGGVPTGKIGCGVDGCDDG